MVLSVWRFSHLLLAVVGGLFIFIASVTGVILSVEPIFKKTDNFYIEDAKNASIAQSIHVLQSIHSEIVSISVDENNFVLASLTTKDGKSGAFYIHPLTGEILGEPEPKPKLFEFATNLHRSLFLKSTGRIIVGVVSFLLLLIAISGFVLVYKRQGGMKKWFSKVVFEKASQYYHVTLSRLSFIPIIIITITGVLLSLERFSVLPKGQLEHSQITSKPSETKKDIQDFDIFNDYSLFEIESLEFPFSPFEEDYFILKTSTEELYINQISGEIISQATAPLIHQVVDWSLFLHTGQGSIVWAVVLGISCLVLIVLMFTGYRISYNRLKHKEKFTNKYDAQEAEYIVLVGSETGSTFSFANRFAKAMFEAKQSVYVDGLDTYKVYKNAKHLIIFTATYGEGESPSNSTSFLKTLYAVQQKSELDFSVVGFGSLLYPDFCQFAIDIDITLQKLNQFQRHLPLFKINAQSEEAFKTWIMQWNASQSYELKLKPSVKKIKGLKNFKVTFKTAINEDDTYLIAIKPVKPLEFDSGDLMAFYPKSDLVERLYSVAKVEDQILLSIKRHEHGICSNFLYHQQVGSVLKAKLKRNSGFHLQRHVKEVVMISNGTGIAPFLGMISEGSDTKIHLFWGGRTEKSFEIYEPYISKALKNNHLTSFQMALSRDKMNPKYVQHEVQEHADLVVEVLSKGGVIMICGAIAMQNNVLNVLDDLTKNKLQKPLGEFENNNQIQMDCY